MFASSTGSLINPPKVSLVRQMANTEQTPTCIDALPDDVLAYMASFLAHERHIGAFACTSRRHRAVAERAIHPTALLLRACRRGDVGAVNQLLVDERVDPTARNHCTLRSSVERGHADVVCTLMDDGRVDLFQVDSATLVRAVESGHERTLQALIEHPQLEERQSAHDPVTDPFRINMQSDSCNVSQWICRAKSRMKEPEERRRDAQFQRSLGRLFIMTYLSMFGGTVLFCDATLIVPALLISLHVLRARAHEEGPKKTATVALLLVAIAAWRVFSGAAPWC